MLYVVAMLHVPVKVLTSDLRGISCGLFLTCDVCHFVKHFELHVLYEKGFINKALLYIAIHLNYKSCEPILGCQLMLCAT